MQISLLQYSHERENQLFASPLGCLSSSNRWHFCWLAILCEENHSWDLSLLTQPSTILIQQLLPLLCMCLIRPKAWRTCSLREDWRRRVFSPWRKEVLGWPEHTFLVLKACLQISWRLSHHKEPHGEEKDRWVQVSLGEVSYWHRKYLFTLRQFLHRNDLPGIW